MRLTTNNNKATNNHVFCIWMIAVRIKPRLIGYSDDNRIKQRVIWHSEDLLCIKQRIIGYLEEKWEM